MYQQTIQVIATAIWVCFAGPIAESIGPNWWYNLGAILAAVLLVLTFFLVPESKYERPIEAYQETASHSNSHDLEKTMSRPVVCTHRPALDLTRHAPRTWKSDMRLWVGKPSLKEFLQVYKVRMLWFRPF